MALAGLTGAPPGGQNPNSGYVTKATAHRKHILGPSQRQAVHGSELAPSPTQRWVEEEGWGEEAGGRGPSQGKGPTLACEWGRVELAGRPSGGFLLETQLLPHHLQLLLHQLRFAAPQRLFARHFLFSWSPFTSLAPERGATFHLKPD